VVVRIFLGRRRSATEAQLLYEGNREPSATARRGSASKRKALAGLLITNIARPRNSRRQDPPLYRNVHDTKDAR